MAGYEETYATLAKSLLVEVVHGTEPTPKRTVDILTDLQRESVDPARPVTVAILESTKIGKILTKTVKFCCRQKLGASSGDGNDMPGWDGAMTIAEGLLRGFKEMAGEAKRSHSTIANVDKGGKAGEANDSTMTSTETEHSSNTEEASCGDVEILKVEGGRPRRKPNAMARFDQQCFDKEAVAKGPRKRARENVQATATVAAGAAVEKDSNGTCTAWQCHKCGKENPERKGRCACKAWRGGKRGKCSPRKKEGKVSVTDTSAKDGEKPKRKRARLKKADDSNSPPKVDSGGKTRRKMIAVKVTGSVIEDGSEQLAASIDSDEPKTSPKAVMDIGKSSGSGEMEIDDYSNASMNETYGQENNGGVKEESMEVDAPCPLVEKEPVVFSEDTIPPSLYQPHQRVYAKDDATGLLYPAMIRKVIWGPKSNQTSFGFASSFLQEKAENDKGGDAKDDDEDEDSRRWNPKHNCWHYYVHYMGWAVNWDRWVEEIFLYEDSASTAILSKTLTAEYKKVKPKRKGQKMSIQEVNKWMKKMMEIEEEHNRAMSGEGGIANLEAKVDGDADVSKSSTASSGETMNEHFKADTTEDDPTKEEEEEDKSTQPKPVKRLNEESLQKMAQLREDGLQTKRKKAVSDRLALPFNLKKVLVDEWEVITQCDMVHNLPTKVTVRDALNSYLESKLAPLRAKREQECSSEDATQESPDGEGNGKADDPGLGKEWVEMVEGIAVFFDQALPAHLLYDEERGQYGALRRQILAQRRNSAESAASTSGPATTAGNSDEGKQQPAPTDDGTTTSEAVSETTESSGNAKSPPLNLLPDRTSEIYGCEHLLRLFVRLPSVLAESPDLPEMQSRRIFSKLGDLVRFLQKNQSQMFGSSFRRPLPTEIRRGRKVNGKQSSPKNALETEK